MSVKADDMKSDTIVYQVSELAITRTTISTISQSGVAAVTAVAIVGIADGLGTWAGLAGSLFVLLALVTSYWSMSLALADMTGSVAVATDISELRKNGYDVTCEYLRETVEGRRIYVYTLRGKK